MFIAFGTRGASRC